MKFFNLLIAMFIASIALNAQQTYIPDDNFEQALIDLGYDNFLNNYVSTSNLSNIKHLDVRFKDISDLAGIEDFTALIELNCSFNNLNTLDVNNNTSLTTLACAFNNINSLDLSNQTNLSYLDFGFNNLSSLDLNNNTVLTALYGDFNNLNSLDVSNGNNTNISSFNVRNNPNLTCIKVDNVAYSQSNWSNKDAQTGFSTNCDGVPIAKTYVPDNNFEQALIDLGYDNVLDDYVTTSNISGVLSLNVSNKGISDLTGIEAFMSLTDLNCGSNSLSALDLSSNTNLTYLNCYYNSIITLDLSNNAKLTTLSCYLNNLEALDLSNNPVLTFLSCSNNNLNSLDVSNGNNTNISSFNVRNNPNLTCIKVDNVAYSQSNWSNKDVQASYSINCGSVQKAVFKASIKPSVNEFITLGAKQLDGKGFIIFPNPVKDVLNIKLNNNGTELIQVDFYSTVGKHILTTKQTIVEVSSLASGIYFIEVQTNLGKSVKRIFVE